MVNYHLKQFLTGHGCFGAYLHRFKKLDDPRCHDCHAVVDNAEHAFFDCDRWWRKRRELEVTIRRSIIPEMVVNNMFENRRNWDEICGFIDHILCTIEEEER